MSNALHKKLEAAFFEVIEDIKENMLRRFAVILSYDEAQSMLMSDDTRLALQAAGKCMSKQYTHYDYALGTKVTIRINCNGGSDMPTILFPTDEFTNFSEDFLDLIRPLYLITKSWTDVILAFKAVCNLIQDTRELNFFVPWLRLVFPNDLDLANQYNAPFRVSRWLGLSNERAGIIDLITRQVTSIITNQHTSKRTWMPSELVQMVRQGEELITQYNIMKSVAMPDNIVRPDQVSVQLILSIKDHPTINWAAEASTHRTMIEADRLRELDGKKRKWDINSEYNWRKGP